MSVSMSDARVQIAAIAMLALGLYANSLGGSFHYDDFHSIVHNPYIRAWENIPGFFTDPTFFSSDPDKAMYRPLLLLTFLLNYMWGQYDVVGYHVVNVGLHAICSVLVWALTRCFGGREGGAFVAGCLFAVHPLCSEPVNYVSSRSELLGALFFLLALWLFVRERATSGVAAAIRFSLGLLSKSIAITLPLILLLHERWMSRSTSVRRLVPFAALGAGYVFVISANRFLGDSLAATPRGLGEQIWTQIKALTYYLKLLVLPVPLNVEHQFASATSLFDVVVVVSAAFLVSLVLICSRLYSTTTRVLLAWPAVALAPSSLVPLNVLVNEHRLYLPLAALAVVVGVTFPSASRRLVALAVFAGLLLASTTVARNAVWADELSLWTQSVAHSPHMSRSHVHLANAQRELGQVAAAQASYERALQLDPDHRAARTNLANLLYEAGIGAADGREYLSRAAQEYKRVLALDPGYKEALINLANVLRALGDDEAAAQYYKRAIEAYPNFSDGYYNLAQLYLHQGRHGEAAVLFARVSELEPDSADVHFQLGNCLALLGEYRQAEQAYRRALLLAPSDSGYRYNLAEVLAAGGELAWVAGDSAAAVESWSEAVEMYGGVDRSHRRFSKAVQRGRQLAARMAGP